LLLITAKELEEKVDSFILLHPETSHIYVVIRWGYTEKEMLNSSYQIELLIYDSCYTSKPVWETDWWEGEEYIDFYGIYTDEDIIKSIIKVEGNKDNEILQRKEHKS